MQQLVDLVIPFIALAILSVGIDKLTLVLEGLMHKIPKLPDKFEWTIAYIIVLSISYLVCWQGDFKLFAYLNINFRYEWEDWLLTALIISGGSAFVRTNFMMIDNIPSIIRGLSTTVKNKIIPSEQKNIQGKEFYKDMEQLPSYKKVNEPPI